MDKITNINVNGTTYDVDVAVEGGYLSEVYASDLEEISRVTAAALNELNVRAINLNARVDDKADLSAVDAIETDITNAQGALLDINSAIETINSKIDSGIHTKEQAVPGDIVLQSLYGTIYVTLDAYNTKFINNSSWQPTAIVVVPASHTQDGTVRAMSTKYMSLSTPDGGSSGSGNMYWGPSSDINDLENYTSDGYYIPSNYVANPNATRTNLFDIGTKWVDNAKTGDQRHSSPYLSGVVLNTNFAKDFTDPVTNTDGASNTAAIAAEITADYSTGSIGNNNTQGNYPAVECCLRYHAGYTSTGHWYLPSAWELAYIPARFNEINASFSKFSSTLLNEDLWSSTEKDASTAWHLTFASTIFGFLGPNESKNSATNAVVAFHKF